MRLGIAFGGALAVAALLIACGGRSGSPVTPSPGPNALPVIQSIAVSDTRIEVGTSVAVTATVTDADTPANALSYKWTSDNGTFSGSGAKVTWQPSADAATPADYTLTLTVSQSSTGAVSKSVSVHVNNSPKELAELSLRFLRQFADSSVSPETCVSEFSDSCKGKRDELADIKDNRHDYKIIASTLRHTSLSIAADRMTATVHTSCSFTSKVITEHPVDEVCQNGRCPLGSIQGPNHGDCWTTNVYQGGRWWLCASHYTPVSGVLTDYERSFFRIRDGGR